jgi:hypothetical protein
MGHKRFSCWLALAVFASVAGPAAAAEPLVEKVRRSIDQAVQYLRSQENGNGRWEQGQLSTRYTGGMTSLALLALMNAGVSPNDPLIDRGLNYLRTVEPNYTYVVGLQTMAFAEAGRNEDRERIQRNVAWLLRGFRGDTFRGWDYTGISPSADNSNTQYALLGLHAAHVSGARIDPAVWQAIRDFYIRTQDRNGGWGYNRGPRDPSLTMTTAGLCGLLIAGMDLNAGREVLLPDGTAANCGVYKENEPVAAAQAWISRHFRVRDTLHPFYNLYGLERAGRLSGQRFFGEHDWYRTGCQYLVQTQRDEGYWQSLSNMDGGPIVATSFALLFLSKGRTPVLVSKLVHGPIDQPSDDWNNDRNDVRHLVEYASKDLFKKQPLAWQIFNIRRLDVRNQDDLGNLTRELLQSPVAYFNGHLAPRFTEVEKGLLKQYVDQGGFLLAEACCGRPEFDQGFRALMQDLFPDNPLKELPPEHPVWSVHALVPPGNPFKLYGIEFGCKTVVMYSPRDLSCLWEANQPAGERGLFAFRLGANILAYATGMELPKPRLTPSEEIVPEGEGNKLPRGYLKVGQLRHDGDWQAAPKAMRNLMASLRKTAHLDVALLTDEVRPNRNDLLDYKFLYMHGRGQFTFPEAARKFLRANLETGGLLFADACCGKERFDTAFRAFMQELFPDHKLERIPSDDELFGKDVNGTAITSVRCRRLRDDGSVDPEFRELAPSLEGIKLDNRWVVIYSKYDIGCALETPKTTSADCLGHDHASAVRLGSAAVLYALKR